MDVNNIFVLSHVNCSHIINMQFKDKSKFFVPIILFQKEAFVILAAALQTEKEKQQQGKHLCIYSEVTQSKFLKDII